MSHRPDQTSGVRCARRTSQVYGHKDRIELKQTGTLRVTTYWYHQACGSPAGPPCSAGAP